MKSIKYYSELPLNEIGKVVLSDIGKSYISREKTIKSMALKTFEFENALDELIKNNQENSFVTLFLKIFTSLINFDINYQSISSWIFDFIIPKMSKYVIDVLKNVKNLMDIVRNDSHYDEAVYFIAICLITKVDILIPLENHQMIFSLLDKSVNISKHIRFNIVQNDEFVTCIEDIKNSILVALNDNDAIEKMIANYESGLNFKIYLSNLLSQKKYEEVELLYFLEDIYNEKILFDSFKGFYELHDYNELENLIIVNMSKVEYIYNYIHNVIDLFPALDSQKLITFASYYAFMNNIDDVLLKFKDECEDAKVLFEFYEQKDLILKYEEDNIINAKNQFLYGLILLKQLFIIRNNSYRYYSPDTLINKILVILSKNKYAYYFLRYIINMYGSYHMYGLDNKISAITNKYLQTVTPTSDIKPYLLEKGYIKFGHFYQYKIYLPFDFNSYILTDKIDLMSYLPRRELPFSYVSLFDNEKMQQKMLNYIDYLMEIKRTYLEKQDARSSFSEFIKNIKQNEVIHTSHKVHLYPIIIVENDSCIKNPEMEIKIGIKKSYVIKDLTKFVDLIKRKGEHKYGKDLNIYHSIDNFDSESREVIKYLVSTFTQNIYFNASRTCKISQFFIDDLFRTYQNNYISLKTTENVTDYYVSDTKLKVQVLVEDNVMKLDDDGIDYIIEGSAYDYACKNGKIYILDVSSDMRTLVKFCQEKSEFSLKYVNNDFVEQVYPRFVDEIKVDKKFKEQIKDIDVKIKTYFYLENDQIVYQSKYFVNDSEIEEESLKAKQVYNYKLSKYNNFLEKLGFKDHVIPKGDNTYLFYSADLSDLKKVSDIYLSEEITETRIKKTTKPTPYMLYNIDMMSVCLKDLNYSNEELYKILQGAKKKQRFVKLNKNTIIEITPEFSQILTEYVSEFDLDERRLAEEQYVPLYYSLKALNQTESFMNYDIDDFIKKIFTDISKYHESNYLVPDELNGVMREYQKDAYKWMKTLCAYNFSGILADDMGLGKTLEIISLLMDSKTNAPSLIISPKSLTYNWKNEFEKWDHKQEVIIVQGLLAERREIIENIDLNKKVVYVTSYDTFKNDIEYYKDIEFEFVILDEAQYIKNHTTLKAQSVKKILGRHKFVLTGTPIENSILDLWSIFDFLMPGYLYNFHRFKEKFETKIVLDDDNEIKNNLIKKITPFILRRTKEDVLKDLPDKLETIQYVKMTEEVEKYYQAELLKLKEMLNGENEDMKILASLTRLRQICVDPSLYIENYDAPSPKLELLLSLIKDYTESGHKIIVFSQFTAIFEKIEKLLQNENIAYFVLTGKTKSIDRVKMAEKFNDVNSLEKVFLVSLKAGGTGLNLVGADIVIHLDPWWNVAVENQATDRAHRIGQKNVVNVIKIVCLDSIEQKVLELQNVKKQMVDEIIANDDENIRKFSMQDIKILLSMDK